MIRQLAVFVLGLGFFLYRVQVYFALRQEKAELRSFLKENDLLDYEVKLHKFGIISKTKFASLDAHRFLVHHGSFWGFFTFNSEKERLELVAQKAKHELQLLFWLQQLDLENKYTQLISLGINSVESLVGNLSTIKSEQTVFSDDDFTKLQEVMDSVDSESFLDSFPAKSAIAVGFSFSWWTIKILGKMFLYTLTTVICLIIFCVGFSRLKTKSQQHQSSFVRYMLGLTLEPRLTKVKWDWEDPHVVGESMSFFLKFYRMNFTPYPISEGDYVLVEIMHDNTFIVSSREYGGQKWGDSNMLKISFTVREAGTYKISVLARGTPIKGSPFTKTFLPGNVDPVKCSILEGGSILEVQQGLYTPLTVEARDKFGNICPLSEQDVHSYSVEVTEIGSSIKTDPELVILPDGNDKNYILHIKLDTEGCFNAVVRYNKLSLSQGQFTIISLNAKEIDQVNKNIKRQCWNVWFEALLLTRDESLLTLPCPTPSNPGQPIASPTTTPLASNGSALKKSQKVYCYITKKQLLIKEFYMKIIPHRLYGFRVRPTTKIILHPPDRNAEHPVFTVDDGAQPPVTVMCKERNVLVATFSRLLLTRIGGSESFKDKQDFFYRELVVYHGKKAGEVNLRIDRHKLLESSYQATVKTLYTSDWLRLFKITFKGEIGVDWGGLRREWVELLCKALFSHESGFFTRFNADDPQALVHPNPKRPLGMKLKFYEFAGRIVGKCLYESALGSGRRLNVKARFTRSFLAQLLGLRVCYRYFESDDKQLYRSKIKYIEETDPEDLGLVFAEEEYDMQGRLEKMVELKPGGAQIPVTESNKKEYLDLLAQYRLSFSVKQEIEAFAKGSPFLMVTPIQHCRNEKKLGRVNFRKDFWDSYKRREKIGLNEMVPDSLLSVFDEYELELLMCGTGNISVSDFRQNHSVINSGIFFGKTLDWFWTIVTSFTQEELARLVQFITGSSQLPPGGFAELSPPIQISSAPTTDALPTAHTCFNQLCLPSYSSFKEMQKKLLLAINEGSEGFGFA